VKAKQVAREGFSGEIKLCLNLNEVKYYSFIQRTEKLVPKFVDEAPAAPNLKIPRLKYFRLLNCELTTMVLYQMR